MQERLATQLMNRAKISPTSVHFEERTDFNLWWCFDSNVRSTAVIMQALTETKPRSPLIPKAVRWLLDQEKLGRWRTTQENEYVVDALATYLRTYEKEEPNFRATIALQGKKILEETFHGRTFVVAKETVPLSQLQPGSNYNLSFKKDGTGRLYYGMRMTYYPKDATGAKDEGVSVQKTIVPLNGKATGIYKPGMLLKVTITVTSNQERHLVAVDDPVPAGCEVVNTSFQTTAASLEKEEGNRKSYWFDDGFDHVERYDDHVSLFAGELSPGPHSYTYLLQVVRSGSYQVPATHAEGMYEPEVFGQTASGIFVIQ
jgi:uncharacterized protein YfaS (alpha-2-macroglobulin family)